MLMLILRFTVSKVDSNLVIVWVDPNTATPGEIVEALAKGDGTQVRALEFTASEFRLSFHCDINADMADAANKKVAEVIRAFLAK